MVSMGIRRDLNELFCKIWGAYPEIVEEDSPVPGVFEEFNSVMRAIWAEQLLLEEVCAQNLRMSEAFKELDRLFKKVAIETPDGEECDLMELAGAFQNARKVFGDAKPEEVDGDD